MLDAVCLFFIFVSLSCNYEKAKPVVIGDEKAPKEWELIKDPATLNNPNNRSNTARIKFKEYSFDFGEVAQGDSIKHEFVFYNTGNSPLWITDVRVSCGCTQPTFPDKPINPGDSSFIGVTFYTAGRLGKQEKSIYVIANTFPTQTELLMYGDVSVKIKNVR